MLWVLDGVRGTRLCMLEAAKDMLYVLEVVKGVDRALYVLTVMRRWSCRRRFAMCQSCLRLCSVL